MNNEIVIKALCPELAEDYVKFLENLDFSHASHWSTCYCRFYHTKCSNDQWIKRTGEENRLEAVEHIKARNMKGYLAFDGEKCIGWCNANDARQYIRLEEHMKPVIKDKKVGCVICFVIHSEYRRQGVARYLLKKAVEDFKAQGFEAVLALPIDNKNAPEMQYRGTVNMYSELGFEEIERQGDLSVRWLKL
jgi:ribosomal protein S18 acetylase RimI-like enzyme